MKKYTLFILTILAFLLAFGKEGVGSFEKANANSPVSKQSNDNLTSTFAL